MSNDKPSDEKKISVRTPWGHLLKSDSVEQQLDMLTEKISKLTIKLQEVEAQKSNQNLPDLSFDQEKHESALKRLEERITNLETEVKDIRGKIAQIREKFAILSQEILKKMPK